DLLRDAIDEIPDIVGEVAALVTLRRVLALAQRALTDGGVAIRRHDGNGLQLVEIELGAGATHRLTKEFLIRIAELILAGAGSVVTLFTIEREPAGMRREDGGAPRHAGETVSDLHSLVVARAEPHDPLRGVIACGAEAKVE